MKFIDLFAGIGGIKIAFENVGFRSIFSNDCDANCKITFDYNFEEFFDNSSQLYLDDISKVCMTKIPDAEILVGGFPCQPFSIAGYQQGFHDVLGRGNLFFDIIKILKSKNIKVFFLENVKNLKSHDQGKTLKIIYQELESLGYHVTDKVLNAMDYGNLPQNRERIYIVGFLSKKYFDNFHFPDPIKLTLKIHDCLEREVDLKYYYNTKPLFDRIKNDVISMDTIYQWRRQYVRENKAKVCPTLTANMGTGGHNVPIILDKFEIRKLTPRECANFQGFPKNYKLPNITDSALYKQFGNSVAIPLVQRIAENIKRAML